MTRKSNRERILQQAWIGDAVLALYTRRRILRQDGRIDGPKAERMTSNRFLSVVAEASETEAQIGRIFEREGMDAAFRWIEEKLMPAFELQEAKRIRRGALPRR